MNRLFATLAATTMLAIPVGVAVPTMQTSTGVWLAVALLGLVTSGFMYWISMRLMREIPASAATSAAFMIPLFGVTWGGLFLGEPVTAGMLPGSLPRIRSRTSRPLPHDAAAAGAASQRRSQPEPLAWDCADDVG